MAPSLVTFAASEPLDKINEIIARDGGVIVSNLLSSNLLDELMRAIEPHFKTRSNYESHSTHAELGEDFFPEGSLMKIMRLPVWQGVMSRFLE